MIFTVSNSRRDRLRATVSAAGVLALAGCGGAAASHATTTPAVAKPASSAPAPTATQAPAGPFKIAVIYCGKYSLRCYAPQQVPLATLVKVAGRRWTVEENFQAGKGLAGLDEHQVRDTWHRLRWSRWRRRHQHRARICHYQRQAARE